MWDDSRVMLLLRPPVNLSRWWMWNKSAQGGEGSGGEGRVLLKCRSGDLLCFAARHSHVPISCLTPPPPRPRGLLLHLPSVWKWFHLPAIVSRSVPAFPPNCFLSSHRPSPPLLLHHLILLVSIMQMVRLPAVIRLFAVLLSCRQQLSGKTGGKKLNK